MQISKVVVTQYTEVLRYDAKNKTWKTVQTSLSIPEIMYLYHTLGKRERK